MHAGQLASVKPEDLSGAVRVLSHLLTVANIDSHAAALTVSAACWAGIIDISGPAATQLVAVVGPRPTKEPLRILVETLGKVINTTPKTVRLDTARALAQAMVHCAHKSSEHADAPTSPRAEVAAEVLRQAAEAHLGPDIIFDVSLDKDLATATAAAGAPGTGTDVDGEVPALEDVLAELHAYIGMDDVKADVERLCARLRVDEMRRSAGTPTVAASRHLVMTGNPGTGKTTIARLYAHLLGALGIAERGHLVEVDRSGLVAGYMGQTAARVHEAFDAADEGVLFIDEAYSLANGRADGDYGTEAIDTIVKLAEDRRDTVAVIVAGYPTEMAAFIDTNPGLASRFARTLTFPDYTTDELVAIGNLMATSAGIRFEDPAVELLRRFVTQERTKPRFGNARVVRNILDAALDCQAHRLMTAPAPIDLVTAEDMTGAVALVDGNPDTKPAHRTWNTTARPATMPTEEPDPDVAARSGLLG